MKKLLSVLLSIFTGLFLVTTPAVAHVVVIPGEVGVGARTNFVVSVPTEEDVPTTAIRLIVPENVQSVRPNVKPGWNIELVKSGEGENERVSEIIWSGGTIPAEQRDEFVFSGQAPAAATTVSWKAYQTYEGGEVVAWDQDPKVVEEYEKSNPPQEGEDDHTAPKPYSTTSVVNDLETSNNSSEQAASNDTATLLSGGAFVLALGAFIMQLRAKK